MGSPPRVPGHEPPAEELTGAHRQFVQATSGDVDGIDAGRLVNDSGNAEPVAGSQPQRMANAEAEHEADDGDIECHPVAFRDRIAAQVRPNHQLVPEAERDRQIQIQMDEVPRLVRQPATCSADGEGGSHDQERGTGRGHEHVRILTDKTCQLGRQGDTITSCVPRSGEQDVTEDQPCACETEPAVPARQQVEAEDVLQPGDARHQHDLHQRRVCPEEGRELAGRGETSAHVAGRREASVAQPHAHDEDGVADDHGENIAGADAPPSRDGEDHRAGCPPPRRAHHATVGSEADDLLTVGRRR